VYDGDIDDSGLIPHLPGVEEIQMSENKRARIGLVGMGNIGSYVYEQVTSQPQLGLEVAFVSDVSADRLKKFPADLVLSDLAGAKERQADLVVEMAHPDVTRRYGEVLLEHCDYMPLSLTAFADAALYDRVMATASRCGTCLYIPHGAIVGLDNIFECRDVWTEVSVTMKKNPRNMDMAAFPQFQGKEIIEPTVLYEGSTRGICPIFPRNVNTHAAVALAGIGFDRTRSILIADPSLDMAVIEVLARGEGAEVRIERANALKGVTGVFTLRAIWLSVCRARARGMSMQIC
jgi:aspartate dehydrogenase